jgi:hypothetical protein
MLGAALRRSFYSSTEGAIMEEYGETKDKDYPRGRGYGNDYMRGGEVFGGYGYSERAAYDRPRGDGRPDDEGDGEADDDEGDHPALARHSAREGDDDWDGESDIERFPQDERAGGWDVPHDVVEDDETPERSASPPEHSPDTDRDRDPDARLGLGADAPEPKIEYTFGDTGGNLSHSRSYYVTQAQLQHRVVEKER